MRNYQLAQNMLKLSNSVSKLLYHLYRSKLNPPKTTICIQTLHIAKVNHRIPKLADL